MSFATIKVQSCEIRNSGQYYLIETEKGTRFGDWREGKKAIGDFPLKVGEVYTIEWEVGGKEGQYKNITYADRGVPLKKVEEL